MTCHQLFNYFSQHQKLIDTINLQLFVRYGNSVEGQVKV